MSVFKRSCTTMMEPGKRNLTSPDFSLYSSRHTKGICSQLGEERHLGVHIAFRMLLLHFRVSALKKELEDIARKEQNSDFWPSPHRKSATREMWYYKHSPTLGKMQENTDQQNLLFNHSLLTCISERGFVELPKYSTSLQGLLCHVSAIHSFTCLLFVSLAGL